MYQPQMGHKKQQSSITSNSDRDILNSSQPSFLTQLDSQSNSNISTQIYDTSIRQSSENEMPINNIETNQSNATSISSADYALNVIFSQFEHSADAKMSFILNMGVVNN
jgi:hypothetical protein